jgi:predicted phage tail protein
MSMKTIRLYGHLGEMFGRKHRFDVKSPAEAVRALCANFPEFRQYIIQHGRPGYRVLAGHHDREGMELNMGTMSDVIKIVPVVAGAGGNFGKILLGAALIGLSFVPGLQAPLFPVTSGFFAGVSVASIAGSVGVSLALAGLAGSLFKPPKVKVSDAERPENRPSFAFSRAINTTGQGNAVAICYGRHLVGSQIISTGLAVDDLPA